MSKTIFQCVGNALLFTLAGLAFLLPFTEIIRLETGFEGTATIFPFLLIAYLIAYPIVYSILAKKYRWGKNANSELAYSDEREKIIAAESTKTAYKVLIGGLLVTIAAIGGVKFYSLFTGMDISVYAASIALLTALLDAATIAYCVKWCAEYRK